MNIVFRLILGSILAAAAVGKLLDMQGFRNVLKEYKLFPHWSLWILTLLMPLIEASIAMSMVSGYELQKGIYASLILHGMFTIILFIELLRGIKLKNCGCFGVFFARPLRWFTPLEDIGMILLTLAVLFTS